MVLKWSLQINYSTNKSDKRVSTANGFLIQSLCNHSLLVFQLQIHIKCTTQNAYIFGRFLPLNSMLGTLLIHMLSTFIWEGKKCQSEWLKISWKCYLQRLCKRIKFSKWAVLNSFIMEFRCAGERHVYESYKMPENIKWVVRLPKVACSCAGLIIIVPTLT